MFNALAYIKQLFAELKTTITQSLHFCSSWIFLLHSMKIGCVNIQLLKNLQASLDKKIKINVRVIPYQLTQGPQYDFMIPIRSNWLTIQQRPVLLTIPQKVLFFTSLTVKMHAYLQKCPMGWPMPCTMFKR